MYNSSCFKLTQKHDLNVYILSEALHTEMIQNPP